MKEYEEKIAEADKTLAELKGVIFASVSRSCWEWLYIGFLEA